MSKRENRRYRRIALDLPARIIVNAIDEYDGRVINISPGNLAVSVDADVQMGDAAVITIPGLDVVEGRIARQYPDGFALSFLLSQTRRRILTDKLMIKMNAPLADDLSDRRATPRHDGGDQRMVCRLADGTALFVKIIDRSVDGTAVEARRKPNIGESIKLGRSVGTVLRHTPRGFVIVHEHQTPAAQKSETTESAASETPAEKILRAG